MEAIKYFNEIIKKRILFLTLNKLYDYLTYGQLFAVGINNFMVLLYRIILFYFFYFFSVCVLFAYKYYDCMNKRCACFKSNYFKL